jgi:tetratricopeptide (TPR) repeat protein
VLAYRPDSTDPVDMQRRARAMLRLAEIGNRESLRTNEAAQLAGQAVAAHRAAYPPNDPNVAHAIEIYANQFLMTDRKQAEASFREAIQILRKTEPVNRYVLGTNLRSLGWVLRREGRLAEAEPIYREALACFRTQLTGKDPRTPQLQCEFAGLLMGLGRFREAETELIDASRQQNNEWSTYYAENSFFVLYTLWNDREPGKGYDQKAREWQKKVVEQYVNSLPSTQPTSQKAD